MNERAINMTKSSTSRLHYVRPELVMLGDIRSLTETGSMVGNEDSDGGNNMCNGLTFPQYNMC